MNISSRERMLIGIVAVLASAAIGYAFVFMLLFPLLEKRKANRALETENATAENDFGTTQARNKKVLAGILPRSLPADLDLGKREYQAALTRLLLEAKVPAGYTVKEKGPDNRGIPELIKGRPAYTKIAYTITMAKVDLTTTMAFLKKYYDLNLLHQITTFTLKRDNAYEIGDDKRQAKDRADLTVMIVTEALVLDGAPSRKTLLSAPVSAGSVFGAAGLFSMENTTPDIGRGIAPYQISEILANPARDYAYVIGKDAVHGKLPPPPPPVAIKEKDPPKVEPPGPDISPYIRLVTLVKSSDGSAHVEIFDVWNNLDFEINMKQKGEKLTIEAMRYMKMKKSDQRPDGRMEDPTFPKEGNMLAFSDEKSSTKHLYKIYGVDGNALILGEIEGKEPAKTGGTRPGKTTTPKPVVDPKPAEVPVEKFYRWEVGAALKGITEMKADEAQKAIQRALGGLLEASGVPAPTPPIAPVDLEVAPKPPAVDVGK